MTPKPSASPSPTTASCEAGVPVRIYSPRVEIDAPVREYTPAMFERRIRESGGTKHGVYPVKGSVAYWTGNREYGGIPGTAAKTTVHFYGHTWIKPEVFNRLKELRPGDHIYVTLKTSSGRKCNVDYVVAKPPIHVAKTKLETNKEFTVWEPRRAVFTGCWRETGKEVVTTENVFVVAYASPA